MIKYHVAYMQLLCSSLRSCFIYDSCSHTCSRCAVLCCWNLWRCAYMHSELKNNKYWLVSSLTHIETLPRTCVRKHGTNHSRAACKNNETTCTPNRVPNNFPQSCSYFKWHLLKHVFHTVKRNSTTTIMHSIDHPSRGSTFFARLDPRLREM